MAKMVYPNDETVISIPKEFCPQHFGEQMQSKTNCANIEKIEAHCDLQKEKCEKIINSKTPTWVFVWVMGFMVATGMAILGVQWKTYLAVGESQVELTKRLTDIEADALITKERQRVVMKTLNIWNDK